jgi:hypothetical protein
MMTGLTPARIAVAATCAGLVAGGVMLIALRDEPQDSDVPDAELSPVATDEPRRRPSTGAIDARTAPTQLEAAPPAPLEAAPPAPLETAPPAPLETAPPAPLETAPPAPLEAAPPTQLEAAPTSPPTITRIDGPATVTEPAVRLSPPPIITTPGAHLLALTKTGPTPAVSASDPGSFMAMLNTFGPGWAAADGTISIPLPDGKTLWLFGDTLLNMPNPNGTLRRNADFVRNSAILHDGATATTLLTGTAQDAGDFLEPADPKEWYWPGHGIVEGDELVVFMGRVRKTPTGAPGWNFEGVGSDMLRLNLSDLSVKSRTPMPGSTGTDWGSAVIDDGTHTYVFGAHTRPNEPYYRGALLARTASGHLKEAAFEYWNGSGWSADPAAAKPVIDGVSPSYSVVRTPLGRYAMVSQEWFFGTKLNVRTADTPAGPWSEWRTIDDGPPKAPDIISYNAQVHPRFTADGKLLASWNMNRSDGQLPGPNQLDGYRPVFRALDVNLLDG